MFSLPQSLIIRLLALWVPRPLSWKRGTINDAPIIPQEIVSDVQHQSDAQVYGSRWNLPKHTEGTGRSAHQATFQYVSAALASHRGPRWLRVKTCDSSTRRDSSSIWRATALSAWSYCWRKLWSRSYWLPSCDTCRITRHLGPINMGLWRAGLSQLTWSSVIIWST